MKKRAKKLALAKETVRGLADDLRQVEGGESDAFHTCGFSYCFVCDAQETAAIWTCLN